MEGGWVERTEPGARRTWEAGVESSGFITFVFDNAVSRVLVLINFGLLRPSPLSVARASSPIPPKTPLSHSLAYLARRFLSPTSLANMCP